MTEPAIGSVESADRARDAAGYEPPDLSVRDTADFRTEEARAGGFTRLAELNEARKAKGLRALRYDDPELRRVGVEHLHEVLSRPESIAASARDKAAATLCFWCARSRVRAT